MKFIFICLFLFVVPLGAQAAVVINEIAWMGTEVSASDEWIELYNDGATAVDVTGWELTDGINLSIALAGSIAAGAHAVLERTDDDSASGTAFLVYTGALANSGATLSVYRGDSSLEDRVAGGEHWESIGGDNTTKETPQYTPDGWVTAEATPGAPSSIVASNVNKEAEDDAQQEEELVSAPTSTPAPSVSGTSSGGSSRNAPTVRTSAPHSLPLSLSLISPERAYVRQEISLSAEGSGMSKVIINSLIHEWNFGDLTTAQGKEVAHRFQYPGEYVVVVHSQYKDYAAYARKTITVLPTSFSITTNAGGDIQVHNDAPYEVDASLYKVAAGGTLTFPEGTIILPNATITIPKEKLQYMGNTSVVLFDDTGTPASSFFPTLPEAVTVVSPVVQGQELLSATTPPSPTSIQTPLALPAPLPVNFTFAYEVAVVEELTREQKPTIPQEAAPPETDTSQMATSSNVPNTTPKEKWPYFALLAVIGLGITVVFVGKGTDKL